MNNPQRHDYEIKPPKFYGAGYDHHRDFVRLTRSLQETYNVMKDERWYTLAEISAATGKPEASVSASIRSLRNPKNGGYYIERAYVDNGLHKYRLDHKRTTNWEPKRRHKDPAGDAEKFREALVACRTHLQTTGYGGEHKPLMDILNTALE